MRGLSVGIFLLLFCGGVFAKGVVSGVRVWHSPEKTRIVFDISADLPYKIEYHPLLKQAVLLLPDTTSATEFAKEAVTENIKNALMEAKKEGLYVTFGVNEAVRVKSFIAAPNNKYGYRLIVDLIKASVPRVAISHPDTLTIMIDAGHGGEDDGATGSLGTKEKIVTLAIAKKLQALINASAGLEAKLVRGADYYVSLKKRVLKSEAKHADIFISIHADKYKDPRVSGASVYLLSTKKGSSEMSRWLEQLEGGSDRLGGQEKTYDSDDLVSGILLDLTQKANQSHSYGLAKSILNALGSIAKLHSRRVQKANFYVLRNSGIPSVLIETGFISNADEELNLMSSAYQTQLAKGIFQAIKSYLKKNIKP